MSDFERRAHKSAVTRHRAAALRAMNQAQRTLTELIANMERIDPDVPLSSQQNLAWGISGVLTDIAEARERYAALNAIQELEPLMPSVLPQD